MTRHRDRLDYRPNHCHHDRSLLFYFLFRSRNYNWFRRLRLHLIESIKKISEEILHKHWHNFPDLGLVPLWRCAFVFVFIYFLTVRYAATFIFLDCWTSVTFITRAGYYVRVMWWWFSVSVYVVLCHPSVLFFCAHNATSDSSTNVIRKFLGGLVLKSSGLSIDRHLLNNPLFFASPLLQKHDLSIYSTIFVILSL